MPAKIAVVFYSMYGHIQALADEVLAGAKEVSDTQVDIFQVQETLPSEVLEKMHAAPKSEYPVIKAEQLADYDGIIFGIPTRYGRAPAQISSLFDQTGGLWFGQKLVGKFAGVFSGTSSQHGGQETTALTTYPFFVHHGMNIVPLGFRAGELSDNSEVVGGSAYGAGSISNADGSRAVTSKEKSIAKQQGKSFAETVATYVKGKESLAGLKI